MTQSTAAKLWAYFHNLSEFDKSLVIGFVETLGHKEPLELPVSGRKRCFLQVQGKTGLDESPAQK